MSRQTKSATPSLLKGGSVSNEMRQLDLTPELIAHFKVIQKCFANPIVEMRNGVCLGCFISMSSAGRQVIESGSGYGLCESCGRIIYSEDA
ncbi:MAG TPA: hypothetical protein PLB62_04235 [Candidatus Sumerlaeota bacterium]|nr:hypothetical protein [Candidatus Sumerlaeota bacterium]